MTIAILYREELKEYDFGPGHPFRGNRYEIFPKFLKEHLSENDNYRILKAEWVTDEDLLLICKKEYVDFVKNYYDAAHFGWLPFLGLSEKASKFLSEDNIPPGRPGKLEEATRLIIGQAKLACDLIQQKRFQKVVSLGGGMHHAKPSYGEGFCIYNDVAFGAKYLIEKYGLERILILDTDAHAGNGTAEYFYQDPKVLFIDLHQDPRTLYPGTGFANQIGEGKGKGFTVNCPLLPDTGWDSYQYVFEEIIEPVVKEFNPQIIIRNGGSDAHFSDNQTNLGLTFEGYRMIGQKMREIANEVTNGKLVDLMGSGYNALAFPIACSSIICGATGIDKRFEEPILPPQWFREIYQLDEVLYLEKPSWLRKDHKLEEAKEVVGRVKGELKDHWQYFR